MHVGGFHAVSGLQGLAGASKGLQGRPGAFGASRGLQNPQRARLKFHAGWSGWTRPPTMAGGGGGGQAEACLQGGVEGVFKGI